MPLFLLSVVDALSVKHSVCLFTRLLSVRNIYIIKLTLQDQLYINNVLKTYLKVNTQPVTLSGRSQIIGMAFFKKINCNFLIFRINVHSSPVDLSSPFSHLLNLPYQSIPESFLMQCKCFIVSLNPAVHRVWNVLLICQVLALLLLPSSSHCIDLPQSFCFKFPIDLSPCRKSLGLTGSCQPHLQRTRSCLFPQHYHVPSRNGLLTQRRNTAIQLF